MVDKVQESGFGLKEQWGSLVKEARSKEEIVIDTNIDPKPN